MQGRERNVFDDIALNQKKLALLNEQKNIFADIYKKEVAINSAGELEFKAKIKPEEKEKIMNEWLALRNDVKQPLMVKGYSATTKAKKGTQHK